MMINDVNNLEEIVVEEAYVFPDEGIHKIHYMLRINKDGNISKYDSEVENEVYYKTEPEKVLELFKNIKTFMDSIVDVTFTIDDTNREITLNYEKGYTESIPSLSFDKDNKYIVDLINDFIETCE